MSYSRSVENPPQEVMDKILDEFASLEHQISTKAPTTNSYMGNLYYEVVHVEGKNPVVHIFKPGEYYLRKIDSRAYQYHPNPNAKHFESAQEKTLAEYARRLLAISRTLNMEWKSIPWPYPGTGLTNKISESLDSSFLSALIPSVGYDGLLDSFFVMFAKTPAFSEITDKLLEWCKKFDQTLSKSTYWGSLLEKTKKQISEKK